MTTCPFTRIQPPSFYWPLPSRALGDSCSDVPRYSNLKILRMTRSSGWPPGYIQPRNQQGPSEASSCLSSHRDRMSTSQRGVLPTALRVTANTIFKAITSDSISRTAASPHPQPEGHSPQFLMRVEDDTRSTSKLLFLLENRSPFVLVKHQLLCSL